MVPEQPIRAGPSLSDTPTAPPPATASGGAGSGGDGGWGGGGERGKEWGGWEKKCEVSGRVRRWRKDKVKGFKKGKRREPGHRAAV